MAVDVDFGFSVTDPETWLPAIWDVGTKAVGAGTPEEQIVATVLIIAVAISASFVTFGATLIIVLVALPFLAIGFLRLGYRAVTG